MLRPELEPLPNRMKDLPIDRGYPVPWFVDWIPGEDGKLMPEFRAMSMEHWISAVPNKLCWVCGKRLGANLAFLIGPMCGISRTTSEPPCHLECAEWSARNCPFLSNPREKRRELHHPNLNPGPGVPIMRNPGVSLVWVTRNYNVFSDGIGGRLIRVGEPSLISFWAEGKPATREQIDASVESGYPNLAATVQDDPDGLKELEAAMDKFRSLLPTS